MVAEHRWVEAARYLDEYVEVNPHDWRAQKWRGIAHAMSRQGHAADAAALDAYKHAIANLPRNADRNRRALLFNYRGAMFKRLARYKEAAADLEKAIKLADDEMLLRDIRYNLACVLALTGDRASAIAAVEQLVGARREMELIRRHVSDYFKFLSTDRQFVALITPQETGGTRARSTSRAQKPRADQRQTEKRRPTSR